MDEKRRTCEEIGKELHAALCELDGDNFKRLSTQLRVLPRITRWPDVELCFRVPAITGVIPLTADIDLDALLGHIPSPPNSAQVETVNVRIDIDEDEVGPVVQSSEQASTLGTEETTFRTASSVEPPIGLGSTDYEDLLLVEDNWGQYCVDY
ncbi:unnamed protein product [Echinostoma caproni]|uniref:NTP_transf_2 domain-containing protein n=1 Tax=Echinostoma caproni TaxID=27848 RepID=A0A183B9J9_9TREM|nr:unnamed protein product [Echinostoma caproni]